MKKKRVFILGAGFSIQVGMPLATELTEPLLERFKQNHIQEMFDWYEGLRKRIEWLEDDRINIEQVFDLAAFDIEAWRMKHQQEPVGRKTSDAKNTADSIDTWLSWMERDLTHVIWEKQKKARPKLEVITKFSQNLQTDVEVLTFNYDTLLEESLTKQSKPWHYGFKSEDGQGIKILKMHGSINWKIAKRGETNSSNGLLFRKNDLQVTECGASAPDDPEYKYELTRVPDDKVDEFIRNSSLEWKERHPVGITGLGAHKPLHLLPGSWEVWSNAMEALEKAEEIYVIGFSLSPFDNMARLHFAGAILKRAEEGKLPERIILIDPDACRLESIFRSVFGIDTPIKLYQQKAEKIDWSQLLSC